MPVVVHKFPGRRQDPPKFIWCAPTDAVAMRPMTLEEAIKEAHFRDRDVFVFRDPKGKVMVLHRTRDGKDGADRSALRAVVGLRRQSSG